MAVATGFIVFVCTFGGALLGMRMRSSLPAHHLGAESKELIHLCMGLIATMTALILGLVTASAKNAFDAQDATVKNEAANLLLLDRTLASYGPETKPLRENLRQAVALAIQTFWPEDGAPVAFEVGGERAAKVEQIERGILELAPANGPQRWLQSQALAVASDALKMRWLSFAGSQAAIPVAFLVVIVFWLTVLFWSFGLFAPGNAMVIGVLLLSALSVAASVFLILEMQSPLDGVMAISSAPLRYALAHLGR